MGQEISLTHFDDNDFKRFHQKLEQETLLLGKLIAQKACSTRDPVAGFEIEAWLVDKTMRPAPVNKHFLATLNDPLASAELAKFNIELNCNPIPLTGDVFSHLLQQLQTTWNNACQHAQTLDHHLVMIGILPTLKQQDLHLGNMSDMHRYRALNEQILHSRGKPIHIDISGTEHLKIDHHDVMLEAATTSFQTHIQLPLQIAHHFYNASIIASAPMVALCANSPFLFGKELWHESRIPLFEQAIETGGYEGAAQGPIKRVSFGSDYARHSIIECFQENLLHFPILLPVDQNSAADTLSHLRLHNGTIWRWNRPLVGFDDDGTPHIRVEHRTPAAGPSALDAIANAAFYYGLAWNICAEIIEKGLPLPFAQAKDNFYQAARYGLDAHIVWFDGSSHRLQQLLQSELLPRAMAGLKSLGVSDADCDGYLGIIRHRIVNKQNGCCWQRQYSHEHDHDLTEMTRAYLKHQNSGKPVSEWPPCE
ncbi:MAG: glutamate--cysteine ligase [Methylococcaceae bacterium]|nr:glutamate--cysteine ligase [Methylococcaceae bacterium]